MELQTISERFIVHWGEMGSKWGVNRTVSQIHALLFLAGKPMHAEEISQTLGVARSNASNSIKELLAWDLIKRVQQKGDRRDYFECSSYEIFEIFKLIVQGRRKRELDPTASELKDLINNPEFAQESTFAQTRMKETLLFLETLLSAVDVLNTMPPETQLNMFKLVAQMMGVAVPRGVMPTNSTTQQP